MLQVDVRFEVVAGRKMVLMTQGGWVEKFEKVERIELLHIDLKCFCYKCLTLTYSSFAV